MNKSFSNCSSAMGIPVVSCQGIVLSETYQPNYALPASSKTNLLDRKHNTTLAVSTKNHARLRPKLIEIVKHRLINLCSKILPFGQEGRFFRKSFNTTGWEMLLHASRCSIHTTDCSIHTTVGLCSDKSIKTYSADGEVVKFQYKVSILVGKLKGVAEKVDIKRPSNKYVEIVTVDDFSFWFLGFSNYKKTLGFLLKTINQSRSRIP